MFLLLTTALLAAEPCYGFSLPEQVEGEHVWVEYDHNISHSVAQAVVDDADATWDDYVETFDWPAPPGPFSILADFSQQANLGLCVTVECDGVALPRCSVYRPAFDYNIYLNTTAHEMAHAFQYGITGPFNVSLSAWAWWMEGTAEYMAYRRHPTVGTVAAVETYLNNPQWRLHHGFAVFLDGVRTNHLYGTAVLAMFIDEYYGGPDTVREIWEWGSLQGADPIFFRDAIEGVGISFDTFWPDYMAHVSVVDVSIGSEVAALPAHLNISLPGVITPPEAYYPEGLGLAFLRVPKNVGQPDSNLVIRIVGDDAVRWHGALARVETARPGATVVDFVGGQSGEDGVVELVLEGFDGTHDAMVALSPDTIDQSAFGFRVEAELQPASGGDETGGDASGGAETGGDEAGGDETVGADPEDPGPGAESGAQEMSDTDGSGADEDEAGGGGCATARAPRTGLSLLVVFGLAVVGRRRRRAIRNAVHLADTVASTSAVTFKR